MQKVKIYEYRQCSTCKKALKFLDKNKIPYEVRPIVESPPSLPELEKMLNDYQGQFKKLFNTSGVQYRELGLSQKLDQMTAKEALILLSRNGKLIKRPFLVRVGEGQRGWVGFKEEEWKNLLK